MTVSEKNSLRRKLKTENFFGNKVGIVTGINNETVTGTFIPDEITVCLELTH